LFAFFLSARAREDPNRDPRRSHVIARSGATWQSPRRELTLACVRILAWLITSSSPHLLLAVSGSYRNHCSTVAYISYKYPGWPSSKFRTDSGFFPAWRSRHKPLQDTDLRPAFDVAPPPPSGRTLTCHLPLVTCHFLPTRIYADGYGSCHCERSAAISLSVIPAEAGIQILLTADERRCTLISDREPKTGNCFHVIASAARQSLWNHRDHGAGGRPRLRPPRLGRVRYPRLAQLPRRVPAARPPAAGAQEATSNRG
jgi:hypothetical protein